MKNKIILLVSVLLLSVTLANAENVPIRIAQRAAWSFLNSKMEGNLELHLVDFAEKAEFPNFYVFGNDYCFVIISADDAAQPVLGYSTENAFVTESMPESTFDWLKAYDEQISIARSRGIEASSEVRSEWNRLLNGETLEMKSRNRVEPLVRTRWQYGTPFNNLCPSDTAGPGGHAKAGCGAVAMAQLMNYWEHPVRGAGSFSYTPSNHPEYGVQYANFGETVYDWDNMRNVYQKTYSEAEALAVATLIYHCGVSVQMNYGPDASGTSTSRLDDALIAYFNYNSSMSLKEKSDYTDNQWIAMLKSDLNAERPIIYRGQSQNNNVGHIFVCDGYDENDYFHFNWGYAGRWDGYYAIGALYGGANYSYVNRAIFGIFPNTTSINPPTNVSTSVNGREVSITWTPVSNAVSYKVYRDGDLIALNVTNVNYIDANAPYGEHAYYVKSVKADGTMSLKSNTSVADVHFLGPVPSNLQASVSGHNVNLLWNAPEPESAILQYGDGSIVGGKSNSSNGLYWAHRFPTTVLSDYAGMAIQKVSFFVRSTGVSATYTFSIYKGDEANPRELVYQQDYHASSTVGWQDVNFFNPIPIDYTKDLWVVCYTDSSITAPAAFCYYSGSGVVDAALYSTADGGTIWKEYLYNGNTTSWLMKTYITDGTYTYNLYRDGAVIANNLNSSSYTDVNVLDGFYDYYVTTNYFGGESDPSNTVHVQVGNPTYTITATANPSSGGTVTGGGTYNYGQTCNLTATANTGYIFQRWTRNGQEVSTDPSYSFSVTESASYVAHFQLQTYTITVSADPSNGGSVTGEGTYNYGQTCNLNATANTGYTFQRWTRNGQEVSTNASYSFPVIESATYVAHFQLDNHVITVTADPSNGGAVTGGGAFHYGDNCTVTATANPGFSFVNWTENGNPVYNYSTYSFVVTTDRTLVAHFTTQNFVITAIADPIEGGTVTGAGGYNYGETCTLTATANAGYNFQRWTRNGTLVSTDSIYTFTVTDSAIYIAHFDALPQNYTITVSANPTNGGTVTGGGTYQEGQTCTVHATANQGYSFEKWTENGNTINMLPDYSFTVTGNRSLVAHFSQDAYEVTVDIVPQNGGTVTGAGIYRYGETATLRAIPDEHYSFVNWTENGNEITEEPTMQLVVTSDHYFTAHFVFVDGVGEEATPIEVFPNPADDVVYVKGEGIRRITMLNMLGQVVEDREVKNQEQIQINVFGYESAYYILRIQTEKGNEMVKLFIKNSQ